jgi:cell division protein FtsB
MLRLNFKLPDVKRRAPAAALLVFYLYIGFHAFSGSQGLVRWMEHADRADHLVDLLSADSLDLDTLDIEARQRLYVAKTNEITIWLDP